MNDKLVIDKNKGLIEIDGVEITLSQIASNREMMEELICRKNRPDFYYICSDELKKDYDFIIFLLNHIKNKTLDKNGEIRKVPQIRVVDKSDETKSNKNKEEKIVNFINDKREVNKLLEAIISNFINDEKCQKRTKQLFSVSSSAITVLDSSHKVHTQCNEICKLQLKLSLQRMADFKVYAEEKGKHIGMGFYYIRSSFNHYDNLLEIFANIYITRIFQRDELCLEKELHKEFYSPDHVLKYGVMNYLLNYIRRCDGSLYAYLYARTYLLKEQHDKILGYLNNWNAYISKEKTKRYRLIFEKIREYIHENVYIDGNLSELDITAYVVRELGLPKGIFLFDSCGYIMSREVLNNINYEYIKEEIGNNYACRIMYEDIKEIFTETLRNDEKTDTRLTNPTFSTARNDLTFSEEKSRCRIISHDFKNNHLE